MLTDIERLYVAQALYKKLGGIVSTRGRSLRAAQDAEFIAAYEKNGAGFKTRDALINGRKVGTYSVSVSNAGEEIGLKETDHGALLEWARENGFTREEIDFRAVHDRFFRTGEIPPGCEVESRYVPAEIRGTRLTIDPDKVAEVMGAELPGAVAGLLDGEVE